MLLPQDVIRENRLTAVPEVLRSSGRDPVYGNRDVFAMAAVPFLTGTLLKIGNSTNETTVLRHVLKVQSLL